MGTPHRGSSYATFGKTLCDIANVALRMSFAHRLTGGVQRSLIETLAQESGELQGVSEDFYLMIQWSLSPGHSLYDVAHARLLSLFTDVVCMFADDFYDFGDVVSKIRAWAVLGRASGQFLMARSKAIIVKQGAGPGPSPTYDLLESEYLQYNLSQPDIVAFFSSVTVLHLADEQISSLARHRPLRDQSASQMLQRWASPTTYGSTAPSR